MARMTPQMSFLEPVMVHRMDLGLMMPTQMELGLMARMMPRMDWGLKMAQPQMDLGWLQPMKLQMDLDLMLMQPQMDLRKGLVTARRMD